MPSPKRLLVANRGEIAVRIFGAARELGIHSVAVYSDSDASHVPFADEAAALPGPASFMDADRLVALCTERRVDAVHPGYGFLSESADFAAKLRRRGIVFVGPAPDVLEQTGNKLRAKQLALACGVPVVPALERGTQTCQPVTEFAEGMGYPVMLKAVDGGGGRGIRLVSHRDELQAAFERAAAESPSHTVFAEKALVDGWRHVEVQILGDGRDVRHFWERECSIQRRYQKIVEIAPSMIEDRQLLGKVIDSAVSIARHIGYTSLGTFEFLVSPSSGQYFFMEINPRLQVEHTVTESICGIDLVQLQLLVAFGQSLKDLGLASPRPDEPPPPLTAIQLRVTAEDVRRNFTLSPGRINEVTLPRGNGVRVDTHIEPGTIVSAEFDSLLAKIIVSSSRFDSSIQKGLRALQDLRLVGVTTNRDLLKGILHSDDFRNGLCDTQWLEKNLQASIEHGAALQAPPRPSASGQQQAQISAVPSGNSTIRKGDAWTLSLTAADAASPSTSRIKISQIFRNDFPHAFSAEAVVTSAADRDGSTYTLKLEQASSTGGAAPGSASSRQRRGDESNPSHLVCPLSGQLVEMLVDEGDAVGELDAVAIVRQMKMELEVRAHRAGTVTNLWDVDDGDSIDAGTLVCEIVDDVPATKPKL